MIVTIYEDSIGPKAHCRSCQAPIQWAETLNGKKMPFDYPIQPRPQGPGLPMRDGGRIIVEVDAEVSRSHFATCPDARRWSRRNGRPARR